MADIPRGPGLNSGLPEHGKGLDEGTRKAIESSLARGKAVVVGGVQDLQRMGSEQAVATGNLPPGETADSVLTIAEHDALTNPAAEAAATPVFDDSYTVEDLKGELESRGQATSGNKQELIDRLNG